MPHINGNTASISYRSLAIASPWVGNHFGADFVLPELFVHEYDFPCPELSTTTAIFTPRCVAVVVVIFVILFIPLVELYSPHSIYSNFW